MSNRRLRYWVRRILRGRWLADSAVAYRGEFGYELKGVVPYAYWLQRQGRLKKTTSVADTRCFYFFSPQHEERDGHRRCKSLRDFPIYDVHAPFLDRWRWVPPPLRQAHTNQRFPWPKPPLVISNKYSMEWGERPINYLRFTALRALLEGLLQGRYTILYNRPGPAEIVPDQQEDLALGDQSVGPGLSAGDPGIRPLAREPGSQLQHAAMHALCRLRAFHFRARRALGPGQLLRRAQYHLCPARFGIADQSLTAGSTDSPAAACFPVRKTTPACSPWRAGSSHDARNRHHRRWAERLYNRAAAGGSGAFGPAPSN